MGIAPNTELYLLKGIPLDSDYTNTIKFESASKQQQFFFTIGSRVIKHFYKSVDMMTKAMSYIQKDDGVLCVGLSMSQCFNCNYIAFKNSSHEDKWFYAFVTKVEYANEKSCYIHYQIDVMQTWMFDYNLGMSFIDRQHHPTDRIGENLVPENLECGSYVCNATREFDLSKMCVALVLSKEIPSATILQCLNTIFQVGNDLIEPAQFAKYLYKCGDSPSGVYNSLYCYSGFILKEDQAYFEQHTEYNIQRTRDGKPIYLDVVIQNIVSGNIEGVNESSIVAVYQYPAWLSNPSSNTSKKVGVKTQLYTTIFDRSISGHVVKNNKLLTSPYSFIRCSNNSGATADYHFEEFDTPTYAPSFYIAGTMTNPPCVMVCPHDYRGLTNDYDNGLILNSFPMCGYVGDTYGKWLSENKTSLGISMLTSVIGGVMGAALGASTLGAATTALSGISATGAIAGSVVGGVGGVASKMGKMSDLGNTPPTVYGHTQCDALNCGIDRVKFSFYHMTIKPEFARIIDDYFTMYGYATNTVDIPNITSRPHWNYIKTINANILPTSTTCIPSDDLHRIRSVYDHGITFWHNGDEVGDYSFDNSPIATYTIEEET